MNQQVILATARPILLIEGSKRAAELLCCQFRSSAAKAVIHTVSDGEEAVNFLTNEGPHRAAPRPSLILLGLDLAEGGGFEMVLLIKNDVRFARIPLIVFSSSLDSDEAIEKVYGLGANCCVQAPTSPAELVRVVNFIKHFWQELISLPMN